MTVEETPASGRKLASGENLALVESPASPVERSAAAVEVAVPVPNLGPLTYLLPETVAATPRPGMRCVAPLGRRQVEGVIVAVLTEVPNTPHKLRPIVDITDREPVLSSELLGLGRFISDYYLAPLGEVLKSMIPSGLTPWGRERVRITDAGAFAIAEERLAQLVLDHLRDGAARAVSELGELADLKTLWPVLSDLGRRGWIRYEGRRTDRGARFGRAFELAGESTSANGEAIRAKVGRSKPGREVVDYLDQLGRPASKEEILTEIGCGEGVLRRLVKLDVLREFVEVRSLELANHRLGNRQPGEAEAPRWTLTDEQQVAVDAICGATDVGGGAFLLHGITGSGKTEVYLRAAEHVLEQGRTTLILVPEIALVPGLARQVGARFGDRHAILHSGLSKQERAQEWERIRSGKAQVVLGPRSALFAPLANLGLLVVDEEHDTSYKQENSPRYHGRDMAYIRARGTGATAAGATPVGATPAGATPVEATPVEAAPVEATPVEATLVLGTATPSLESRHNVERQRLQPLAIRNRVADAQPPEGEVVDLRLEPPPRRPGEIVFSRRLLAELQTCLDEGRQAILLRNRRGYAPVLLCAACGHDHACTECGLAQTVHRKRQSLKCHFCGASRPIPNTCAECGREELDAVGAGTERVEEQVRELFPAARVDILDRDTARGSGLRNILERFGSGESDILVGTQMVAKGHHFPNVALAAVLNADTYLSFPDFRGVERTYALLAQLAGRAGRGEVPGKVLIQTRQPDHYAIQAALRGDDKLFAQREMEFRRHYHYPPFSRLIEVVVEDRNRKRAHACLRDIAHSIRSDPKARGLRLRGPQAAPYERLAGRWRYQALILGDNSRQLRDSVARALPQRASSRILVDVDPYQLF